MRLRRSGPVPPPLWAGGVIPVPTLGPPAYGYTSVPGGDNADLKLGGRTKMAETAWRVARATGNKEVPASHQQTADMGHEDTGTYLLRPTPGPTTRCMSSRNHADSELAARHKTGAGRRQRSFSPDHLSKLAEGAPPATKPCMLSLSEQHTEADTLGPTADRLGPAGS
ncbi:Hypothetical predicted protein [Pelobates cultripes]|uniref:Uncharacterized protein n=1 Tax=Pelobates cultripes TaxID=61616 RepID=A0AAD1QXT3_PELCU|nr:Hypothetical predicted protein [Pelobates cultripes]